VQHSRNGVTVSRPTPHNRGQHRRKTYKVFHSLLRAAGWEGRKRSGDFCPLRFYRRRRAADKATRQLLRGSAKASSSTGPTASSTASRATTRCMPGVPSRTRSPSTRRSGSNGLWRGSGAGLEAAARTRLSTCLIIY
jgi:hypothetical protein